MRSQSLKLFHRLLSIIFVVTGLSLSLPSSATSVNFSGFVGLVEVRTYAWGDYLVVSIVDASGNRVQPLCSVNASDTSAVFVLLSDSAAKGIQANALAAKALGRTVTGWGLDPSTPSPFCAIGNFAIQ